MLGIKASARAYEDWLKLAVGPDFVKSDLKRKHHKMRCTAFAFLRATYWRWAEIILDICPNLAEAPSILAVGDTHLENFGTWRDVEGRLVWGVNDFDDAALMPYPLDLVRLAASAILARRDGRPSITEICAVILSGYRKGLTAPAPVILERDHKWLRNAVMLSKPERAEFWSKFDRLTQKDPTQKDPPPRYLEALSAAMPEAGLPFIASPRTAGTGSLGRPRFIAYTDWRGGPILREAKALVPSAWSLCHSPDDKVIKAGQIAAGRYRAPDPHYRVGADDILVRRLSPNSRKIEAENDADDLLRPEMLDIMAFEIANCHGGDGTCLPDIRGDLDKRGDAWLHAAAKKAAEILVREFKEFD